MTNIKQIADDNIKYEERFSLAVNRIRTIHTELWDQTITLSDKHLNSYFIKTSYFALQLSEIYNLSKSGILRTLTETELFHLNKCLYEDIEKAATKQAIQILHMPSKDSVRKQVFISVLYMLNFAAISQVPLKNAFLT